MSKKIFYVLTAILLVCTFFSSCSDDEEAPTDIISPTTEGTFTDERDGNTYRWVRYGNLDWLADNFRYNQNDASKSRLYEIEEKPIDANKYGRIYSHTGAIEACPEGWRLPTDEDWKNLEEAMGMSSSDANKKDWRSNIAMRMMSMYETTTPINILLSGYYTPNMTMGLSGYRFYATKGYYWTASTDSEKGDNFYFFREFMYNNSGVRRQSTTNDFFMSVKYVRDAQ